MQGKAESRKMFEVPDLDIRERMATLGSRLPHALWGFLQLFLTWITGKPHRGQRSIVHFRPLHHLCLTLLSLALGVCLSLVSLSKGGLFLLCLPVSLVLTISAQRKLFLSIVHGTLHETLVRSERANRIIGDAITLLIFSPPYSYLYTAHVGKHHGKAFCTLEDPDAQALYSFGIRPGTTRRRLWLRFLATMFSPRFHAQFIWLRIQTNFRVPSPVRMISVVVFLTTILSWVYVHHAWLAFVIAWLVPNFPGFHIAALINFAGEHRWYCQPKPGEDRHVWYLQRTHGRFVGSRLPDLLSRAPERYFSWLAWWFVLCFWHLPLRLLVIPADMPAHDHHHANVKGDWANAIYDRQRALEVGAPYTETWGVFKAIDLFFTELSHSPPLEHCSVENASSALMGM